MDNGWIAGLVVGAYVLLGFVGVTVLRRAMNACLRAAADSLTQRGARVLALEPASSILSVARLRFELDERLGRITIRWWGRGRLRIALQIDSAPRPGAWLRVPGRMFDGLSRALGYERLVPCDGGEVSVATRASDETIRGLLASPETQRVVRALVQTNDLAAFLGGAQHLVVGSEGVAIVFTTRGGWSFDANRITPVLERLEALDRAMPRPPSAEVTPLFASRPPVVSVFAPMYLLAPALAILLILPHYPMNTSAVTTVLLLGLAPLPLALFLAWRRYRGRPNALVELLFTSMGLVAFVPFLTADVLMAANSGLDHSPPTIHRVHVVDFYKHNTHTVYVESWIPGVDRQKVVVPKSIPNVARGDVLDVTTQPGFFGWMWSPSVVKP